MATAYAALVSLLNDLDLMENHSYHSFSFDNNQIQSLLERVHFLIETCDYHGASEAFVKKIAVAAHAAEDVILSHVSDQIRSGSALREKKRPPRFLLDLQEAIEDMEFVRRKAIKIQTLGFHVDQPTFSSIAAAATPSTHLTSQKNTMVGFDEVLHQLLELLTREGGERVIPIVAMGGAGKTTLARNAFQHKLVVEHFDVCLWATISQQYDVEGILNQLLGCKSTSGSIIELGAKLHKYLFGRRYLIILDDMWSFEPWEEIKFYFPQHKDNKSRIIVTSRQSQLADHLSSSPRFNLDLLDKENSWILFCEKVFGDKQGCPPELQVVGQRILKKCGGLPLAIVVMGGHLRNSLRTQEYWENVANHMDSILSSEVNESCLDILSLSYSYLPIHLKPCFLYMGILKEDQRIEASSLMKLWIGEGFIKSSKTQSFEEIAECYLKDLVDRNLILACERKWNKRIMSCELHDIVRELCMNIAKNEKFLCLLDKQKVIHRERRVVLRRSNIKWDYFGKPHIRSLRVLNGVDGNFLEEGCYQVNIRHLSCFIDTHQRSRSFCISPSISLLWSLQTIILTGSYRSVTTPHEFWEMIHLRHLEIDRISLPDPLPSDSGRLIQGNLQTLLGVENLMLSEEVCKRISHIKELRIKYTDLRSDEMRPLYCLHNISLLQELESLNFSLSDDPKWRGFAQSLRFPDSLKELLLTRCHLFWEELSMMAGSLPLLETLDLRFHAVIGSQWNTIEGHFNHLKSLAIYCCDNLVNFNTDDSHFPALRVLVLWRLPKLNELPSCIAELPSLQRIRLTYCSVSLAMSAMRILVEQEQMYGNAGLQLEVSFWGEPGKKRSFKKKIEEEGLDSNNLRLLGN